MRRERIQVRDAADIRRVRRRVLTRWRLPRIEVSTERFPKLAAQYAQERFTRLAESCNCLLGEALGGLMLLGGTFTMWVSRPRWLDLGRVLIASLSVLLIGKTVEILWTRVRMLVLLRQLRRRLDSSVDLEATRPVSEAWLNADHQAMPRSSTGASQDAPPPRPLAHRQQRPMVLLGNATDVRRLRRQVITKWTLPRIQIGIDGLSTQQTQRVQHRYTRLTDGASYMLAGVLAGLTLLLGVLVELRNHLSSATPEEDLGAWLSTPDWSGVKWVLIATLIAGVAGWAIECAVIRFRLLRTLRALR